MRTRATRKCHLQVEPLEGRFSLGTLSGGDVLPSTARPHGYSLTDMSRETAVFNETNNDPNFYPKTPFQVLYADPNTESVSTSGDPDHPDVTVTGSNTFNNVSAKTPFYVPILTANDAGTGILVDKFPKDASGAAGYVFGQNLLGATGTEIIVDGKSTPVGAAYVVGPVQTPSPLPDGSQPHIITLAAFLSPMSVGTHTVDVKAELTGQAFQADTGLNSVSFDFTYTVHVVNS